MCVFLFKADVFPVQCCEPLTLSTQVFKEIFFILISVPDYALLCIFSMHIFHAQKPEKSAPFLKRCVQGAHVFSDVSRCRSTEAMVKSWSTFQSSFPCLFTAPCLFLSMWSSKDFQSHKSCLSAGCSPDPKHYHYTQRLRKTGKGQVRSPFDNELLTG